MLRMRTATVIGCFLLGLCCSGCTALMIAGAGAAGAAGYAYLNGELEKSYPVSVGQAWPAVTTAVEELGMPVVKQSVDDLGGRLETVTADGKKVVIKLEARPTVTTIKVRVGLFGDKNRSIMILDRIDQKLMGSAARATSAATPGGGTEEPAPWPASS